jgi:ribosomal protein L7/L12
MMISRSDFATLNRRVLRVEALLEAIAARLEIPVEEITGGRRTGVSAEVANLAAAGKKIAAIKLLREQQQGLNLATAKRIVDEL